MAENEGYWLEVMYPLDFADHFHGKFPLHKLHKYAIEEPKPILFQSSDERDLTPGRMMQADSYRFDRKDKAEECFEYARHALCNWRDSHRGLEYLVRLAEGSLGGTTMRSEKGTIGQTSPTG
jgi:hypothetical protein